VVLVDCGLPAVCRTDGRGGSFEATVPGSMPLGIASMDRFEASLRETELEVPPGGHLLLATDGLQALLDVGSPVVDFLRREGDRSPTELTAAVEKVIAARGAEGPARQDDVALVDLRRDPA
jgi:serine/threonine protein phosphatase PrpC